MVKEAALLVSFFCFFNFSWSQNIASDKGIQSLYAISPPIKLQGEDSLGNFLIKFRKPGNIDFKKYRLLKRISYNYFVVRSSEAFRDTQNIISTFPASSLWKATDNLLAIWKKHPHSGQKIAIVITTPTGLASSEIEQFGEVTTRKGNVIELNLILKRLPELLDRPYVAFANTVRTPFEELVVSDIDLSVNTISSVAKKHPEIDGSGINVSIKEKQFDRNDLDIVGRSFESFKGSEANSEHATVMATLLGGNGNSFIKGLGAAPNVRLTSSDFSNLLPDSVRIFNANCISVQNHSYGTGIENYYGSESAAYDQQMVERDTLVHVFSAGNLGLSTAEAGLYEGIKGFANLSGSFKQAKNVLVVGGTNRENKLEDLSSRGPTYDGRIKPELVADGQDGTSGAAALVSGTVALLQQAYKDRYHHLPSSALIKSILINSTDKIGLSEVSYESGFGKLNALEALRTLNEARFLDGVITEGDEKEVTVDVPPNCCEFKVSLAWNDAAAMLNAPVALINDLDLSVTDPNGKLVLPWTLSSYPASDSLSGPAVRRSDTLNTAERVTIHNPTGGRYLIRVRGSKVPSGLQAFSISYQNTAKDQFEWTYPIKGDHLFAGDVNYLRWQGTVKASTGQLTVSYDHGRTWEPIGDARLADNYFKWSNPEAFTKAVLRMETGGQKYISEEFTISSPLKLHVGYNCTNGALLKWNPQPGSKGYTLYTIKDNLLQKLFSSTDTITFVPSMSQSSSYYAVSALGDGFEGVKSYTINVNKQGVGCYFESLLAKAEDHSVLLSLTLGTSASLKSIIWEKLVGGNTFTLIGSSNINNNSLTYYFTDTNPKEGIQYYRVRLTTDGDKLIYSDTVRVAFLSNNQFVIYPNPATEFVNILNGAIDEYSFKMYDSRGKLVIKQNLNELQTKIQLNAPSGVYFYVIDLKGAMVREGKLIVSQMR